MNDKFLKNYRISPKQAFANDLHKRLEIDEKKIPWTRSLRIHPVTLGAVTLLLALFLTLAVSPTARAQVVDWVGQVGGVLFTATGDYPGGDEPVTVVPSDEMSLGEARAVLPFEIDLPAWLPEGYYLDNKVSIPHFEDGVGRVYLNWRAPRKAGLGLNIEDISSEEINVVVAPGSIEEVLINGVPAALVRGGWNADAKLWKDNGNLQLYVPHKGQTYTFYTIEQDISVDELIHIAESLP